MFRWTCFPPFFGVLLLGLSTGFTAWAAPPVKIADFATVADLEAEVKDRLQELEPFLADENAYTENLKRLKQVASMLAVAAQGLVEHEHDSEWKPFAADLRDAAIQIARSKTFAEAQPGLPAAQAAFQQQSPKTAVVEYDWAKLVKQRPIMEEMEARMLILQRALRRPKDPVKESQHAAAVAVANLTTLADTHEVKDKSQLPEWDKLSRQMLEQMKQTTAAIRNNQPAEAQAHFKAARATCVECHRQFNKEH